jgi:NADH-quinone oxidoreductase subunit J
MREYLFQIIFYLSAALAIAGAVAVVLQKNPVRAVLSLVFSFFMISIVWIMCNAEFLALVLVLVYVGAVMTLFLFVVMMLNIDNEVEQTIPKIVIPVSIGLLIAFLGLLWLAMPKDLLGKAVEQAQGVVSSGISNTQAIGQVLYIDYIAPVELTALLLLVAIIASITLVHRGSRNAKRQDVKKQIMVRRRDRVKLVDIPSEIKH